MNRTGSPEVHSGIYGPLILTKVPRIHNEERTVSSPNVWDKPDSLKQEAAKLLQENIKAKLLGIGLGYEFFKI